MEQIFALQKNVVLEFTVRLRQNFFVVEVIAPYKIGLLHHATGGDKALIVVHDALIMPTIQIMFTE